MCAHCVQKYRPSINNVFREAGAIVRAFSGLHGTAYVESFAERAFVRDYHLWILRNRLPRAAPSSILCFLGRRPPSEPD
jgi:hypothetical protein